MTEQPILYENAVEIDGQDLRHAWENPAGEGVNGRTDLQVTAGTGLAVNVSSGSGYIRGRTISDQGLYRCRSSATKSSDNFEGGGIPANSSGNPRLDQIIAKLYDHDADASGFRKWALEVLPGTPTAGATLANRNGATALPADSIRLADVLVASGASSLTSAEIRDRRRFILRGTIPPVVGGITAVGLEAVPPLNGGRCTISHADHDGKQAVVAMFLPRRQTSVARIRWKYAQGSTALTGNYVIAIYDSTGCLIVDTGSIAFAGAADTFKEEIRSITSTEFDGGVYYVLIGVDTGTGTCEFWGVDTKMDPTVGNRYAGAPTQNLAFRVGSGGLTVPASIQDGGFTDIGSATSAALSPPVPLIALSVGT